MTQPALQLNTNKSLASVKNITIRDSGNKEVLEAYFLDQNGQPYNLENKAVTFMENKDGDKFVSDPNVQIVDATGGFVRYTLQSQVHSASGIAWFEINDNSGLVDSTGNFNIRVENGLRATADNTTYIDALEKLKQQMEALIAQADGDLKAELQKADQQLSQELQDFRNQYNSLSNDFQNQFKDAQNARQQDYDNQKNAINADWTNNKNQIWSQWGGDKANIDKQAQDTIQAIKDNAQQVVDKDQADWNAKQASWDDTFSRIVKEWQVKTSSLDATVQDLTTKFGNIINELTDLMNNKLPDMNAKTDAAQAKIDELRASLRQIDWTSFVKSVNGHTPDANGAVTLPSYDNPTAQAWNTTVDLNSDPYLNTGIYQFGNCTVKNGPYDPSKPQWFYLKVVKYDDNNIYQTISYGTSLGSYIRRVSKKANSFPSWTQYATMDKVVQSVNGHAPDANGTVTLPTLTAKTLTDFDIESGKPTFDTDAHFDENGNFTRWPVDQGVIGNLANAHKDVRNHTDYRYPTATATDVTTNLNSDPYLDTGIYKINNCPVTNGPWSDTKAPHWFYLNVAKYDDYNIIQTMNLGYTLYSRIVSVAGNSFPSWTQYATMDKVVQSVNGHAPDANGTVTLPTLTAKTLTDFDIESGKPTFDTDAHFDENGNFTRWPVDQGVIGNLANAHKDVRNHTDYRYPTDQASDTAVNLNSDPYLDTGIYQLHNCAIINGPFTDTNHRFWLYLKVIKYDDNTICQIIFNGDTFFGRRVSKSSNSFPSWTQYATMGDINDVSDRLSAVVNNLGMFQRRVDYDTPSGTISNQTVDFNNYQENGILRVENCAIQNGPYGPSSRHWVFLKVVAFDSNTVYQTVYEGDNLYGRKLYNGAGQWHKYTNTPI